MTKSSRPDRFPPPYRLAQTAYQDDSWDDIVQLRLEVYVDEQKVPLELELDDLDRDAVHFALRHDDELVATLRIVFEPGPTAHIGRLAVRRSYRRRGLARKLLEQALVLSRERGCVQAVLDAQTWITHLYASLGFAVCSDRFLDAGIPHFRMRRDL